jgi:hypothetical protein
MCVPLSWPVSRWAAMGLPFPGVRVAPGPMQRPHVPLMICDGGERVTRRQEGVCLTCYRLHSWIRANFSHAYIRVSAPWGRRACAPRTPAFTSCVMWRSATRLASAMASCRSRPYCWPISVTMASSAIILASCRSSWNPKVIQPAGVRAQGVDRTPGPSSSNRRSTEGTQPDLKAVLVASGHGLRVQRPQVNPFRFRVDLQTSIHKELLGISRGLVERRGSIFQLASRVR